MKATVSNADPAGGAESDAELLRGFISHQDDCAFGRLVGRHAAAVHQVALARTGNAEAAEDVTQASLIVLARRPQAAMRSAKRHHSVRPWLLKVARHAAANWRRAEARRRRRDRGISSNWRYHEL